MTVYIAILPGGGWYFRVVDDAGFIWAAGPRQTYAQAMRSGDRMARAIRSALEYKLTPQKA